MYQYRTEFVRATVKWFIDTPRESDIPKIDNLVNLRSSEGWELVTYVYVRTGLFSHNGFLITFRKLN